MSTARPRAGIVLASASPRRRLLMGLLGVPFQTAAADVDEQPRGEETPSALAHRLARSKASAIAAGTADLVVAADSVVVLDGRSLGKPNTAGHAEHMLRQLRGQEHEVITAVAVYDASADRRHETSVVTRVQMRQYGEDEIQRYVASGAPMDKAGAYGIQDEPFTPVHRIYGCYLNVVGLPLCEVARGLAKLGRLPDQLLHNRFVPPCRLCFLGAAALGATIPGIEI